MKIDLLDIEISGLRDFDVDQKISLPSSQVTSVIGRNKDDGGSNGTGKSTFAMAPIINLYGPTEVGISSKNLKNRYLSTPVVLTGTYKVDDQELVVERTIGGKLRIKFKGQWEEGKSEDIQNRIYEITKMSPEQCKVLTNKAQGDFGGFLLMTDSKKKDFLGSFFDVSFIEIAKEKADKTIETQRLSLSSLKGRLDILNSNLEIAIEDHQKASSKAQEYSGLEYGSRINGLNDRIKDLWSQHVAIVCNESNLEEYLSNLPVVMASENEAKVVELSTDRDSIAQQIDVKKVELDSVLLGIKERVAVPDDLINQQKNLELAIADYKRKTNRKVAINSELSTVNFLLDQQKTRYEQAEFSICEACQGPINPDKIHSIKAKIEQLVTSLLSQRMALFTELNSIEVKDEDETILQEALQSIKSEMALFLDRNNSDSFKKKASEIKDVILSLQRTLQSHSLLISGANQRVKMIRDAAVLELSNKKKMLQSDLSNTQMVLDALKRDKELVYKTVETAQHCINRINKDIVLSQEELNKIEDEISVLSGVCEITSRNGFVGYIFDSILDDLNSEINLNLGMIPNARKFSLQFTPDKIAKTTGAVSKSISYQLFSGSDEVEFNTLSGGEKLSVIISVDEALDSVLSRRLGISVGWKFLDEQFSWIDENSKEAILEFYKSKSSNRAYFIVDHASEFNASLENRIIIVKENNLARFEHDLQ